MKTGRAGTQRQHRYHAATRRFSNEATYPATRRFSMSQRAHWFASCPGHILAKSHLAALIPNGTRHGSALGRRHLTERRRADSRIDIRRTSGPGIRKAPRPQRIRPSSCWAWASDPDAPVVLHMPHPERTGAWRKPNARNNKRRKQVRGGMDGHETILSTGNWCCVDQCSHVWTEF